MPSVQTKDLIFFRLLLQRKTVLVNHLENEILF